MLAALLKSGDYTQNPVVGVMAILRQSGETTLEDSDHSMMLFRRGNPFPATVEIIPVATSTRRIRLCAISEI